MLWRWNQSAGLFPLRRRATDREPEGTYLRAGPQRTHICIEDEKPAPYSPARSMAWLSKLGHRPDLSDLQADLAIPARDSAPRSTGWRGLRTPPQPRLMPYDHGCTSRPASVRERRNPSPRTSKMRPRCTLRSLYSS